MKRLLIEVVALVLVAGVAGTGFHVVRSDAKAKIAFIKKCDFTTAPTDRGTGSDSNPGPVTDPGSVTDTDSGSGTEADTDTDADTDTGTGTVASHSPDDGIIEITAAEAHEEYDPEFVAVGAVVVIDARKSDHFEAGHIKGAHNLAVWEGDYEQKLGAFINAPNRDPDALYLIYCTGSDNCEDSHMVARRLKQAGFSNLRIIEDGYSAWAKAGYPTEKGPEKKD